MCIVTRSVNINVAVTRNDEIRPSVGVGIVAIEVGATIHRIADHQFAYCRLDTCWIILRFIAAAILVIDIVFLIRCIEDGILTNIDANRAVDQARIAGAENVAVDLATIDVDERGPIFGMVRIAVQSIVVAAIDIAHDMAATHVDRLHTQLGTAFGKGFTATKHIHLYQATIDVDHSLLTDQTHVAAAINAVDDIATIDIHSRMAFDKTCRRTGLSIGVKVDATATTINITLKRVAYGNTDGSTIYGDFCILVHVTVLASTEHTAFDDRLAPNLHIRIVGAAQFLEFGTSHTTRRAKHVAMHSAFVVLVTNYATRHVDLRQSSTRNRNRIAVVVQNILGVAIFIQDGITFAVKLNFIPTHRRHIATAIHVTTDLTSCNNDVSVAIDMT